MAKRFGNAFSDVFQVDPGWLKRTGVFNPTLDVDSPLFIDPFLLPRSRHKEFSETAFELYEAHFTQIYKLLRVSSRQGDKAWKAAAERFSFSEGRGLSGTCLGYSKGTSGRGFGPILSAKSIAWAKEVIDLGVKDPELFSCMSVFEENIGPDRISDMTANIILPVILSFNDRIYRSLDRKIAREEFNIRGHKAQLPVNPYSNTRLPVILLPHDILKHLPILDDVRELPKFAAENKNIRERVNQHVSFIWEIKTREQKDILKRHVMESAAAFQAFLDLLKRSEKGYDIYTDPDGLLEWRSAADSLISFHPLKISDQCSLFPAARIDNVCRQIITQFANLIENQRANRLFYVEQRPRHERFAQLLFLAIATSYCDANNLDISPESDAGAGPVDFKLATGKDKVVVEIKLSTNTNLVHGYEKQLKAYTKAEKANFGHYVVIDVGKLGRKWERIEALKKEKGASLDRFYTHLIDGTLKESASKLV